MSWKISAEVRPIIRSQIYPLPAPTPVFQNSQVTIVAGALLAGAFLVGILLNLYLAIGLALVVAAIPYWRLDRVLVVFLIVTLLWPHKLGWHVGWIWNPSRILLMVMLLTWILAWSKREVKFQRTPLDMAFFLFIIAMLVSFLVNSPNMNYDDFFRAMKTFGYAAVEWILLYYLVTTILSNYRQVRKFLIIFIGLISIVALVGIVEYKTGVRFYEWLRPHLPGGAKMVSNLHEEFLEERDVGYVRGDVVRIVSTTISYQEVGSLMAMSLPLIVFFIAYARKWWERLLWLAPLFLVVSALLLSVTRGAVIASVVAILFISVMSKKWLIRASFLSCGLVIAIVIALIPNILGAFESVATPARLSTEASFQSRLERYPLAAEMLQGHELFGLGLGQITGHKRTDLKVTDNWYLAEVVETGLFGIATVLLMWGAIVALLIKRKYLPGKFGSEIRDMRLAILASGMAFMIMCYSYDAMVTLTVSKMFFVIVAFGVVLLRYEQNKAASLHEKSSA